ncbi:MAG TPA: hypothetical protein VFY72_04390 [Beijerinckiaceae bacterium]|jgi:hypothetical protein|nr:hypothetical protein [Beijerinckiaceae bacterium]
MHPLLLITIAALIGGPIVAASSASACPGGYRPCGAYCCPQ